MNDDTAVRWQGHVTRAGARAAVTAALAHAETLGAQIGVSVVDANGFLVEFARMDLAPARVEEGSSGKARFAALLGRSTGEFIEAKLRNDEVLWRAMGANSDIFIVPGGFPLLHTDHAVGGVGVSGSKHEIDSEIARVAAEHYNSHPA